MKISIPDDHPPVIADSSALLKLKAVDGVEVEIWNDRPDSDSALLERINGAHTVINIRSSSRFSNHVIESAQSLRHIAIWGTGTDNVDLEAARRNIVVVTNTPNTATEAVAEHTIALLLSLARRVPELDARVRRGEWPRGMLTQLSGNTLGIIGTGKIGKRTAEIARGMRMNVIAWSRNADHAWAQKTQIEYVDFGVLLRQSDAISLHLRLSAESRGMISTEQLAQMKSTSLLVNTGRGELVDETALAEALGSGAIAGAALDTFEEEPLPSESPLRGLPNAILSPHTAGTTSEALANGLSMVVANTLNFFNGDTANRVV